MLELLSVVVVAFAVRGARSDHAAPVAAWAPIVVCDEVRIELDTAALVPTSGAASIEPVRARLRWSLLAPDVSPAAWAQGVRMTIDEVEVDCASASSRTLTSRAFAADGALVPGASLVTTEPAWRRGPPASVGALVVAAVCRSVHGASGAA